MNRYIVQKKPNEQTKNALKLMKHATFDFKYKTFKIDNRTYKRGATRLLKACFYENYAPPRSIRSKRGSSRALGDYFHRQVCHHFTCVLPEIKCVCKEKFGKSIRKARPNTLSGKRIIALQKFLDLNNLRIIECELPVGWIDVRAGTCLDALAQSKSDPNYFCVLEFKTGYSSKVRNNASTEKPQFDNKKMTGKFGIRMNNTPYNQHNLQLMFGMHAFESCYNVKPKDGILFYFDGSGAFDAYHFRSWTYSKEKTQQHIIDQLCDYASKNY